MGKSMGNFKDSRHLHARCEYSGDNLRTHSAICWQRQCHFYGIIFAMKTTIDAAGRMVVPKRLREALGLKAGQPLEIRAGDGRLEVEIAPTPMQLTKRGKGLVAVPDAELPQLTADQVRDTLER